MGDCGENLAKIKMGSIYSASTKTLIIEGYQVFQALFCLQKSILTCPNNLFVLVKFF